MTEQDEDIYISKETFPVGTAVLTWGRETFPPVMKEYHCLQWSEKGRCKIYDALEVKTFWAYDPYYIILEVLPPVRFTHPYDLTVCLFDAPKSKIEWEEDCEGNQFPKKTDNVAPLAGLFDSLYNITNLGRK